MKKSLRKIDMSTLEGRSKQANHLYSDFWEAYSLLKEFTEDCLDEEVCKLESNFEEEKYSEMDRLLEDMEMDLNEVEDHVNRLSFAATRKINKGIKKRMKSGSAAMFHHDTMYND